MFDEQQLLKEAKNAIREKNKAHARKILDQLIQQNPQNDQAWMYLAFTIEDRNQALACLQRATQINPANDKAWELIARLEQKTKAQNQDKDQSRNQQQIVSDVKKKGINWIGIFFVVILGVVGTLCCLIQFSKILLPSTDDVYSTPTTYRITYKITGTASRASLTYQNAQGGTEQTVVSIPWQESLTVGKGDFLYLSAQNEGEFGSVTCEIWVNDVKWKESTSRGAYVIATCSGSAGRD